MRTPWGRDHSEVELPRPTLRTAAPFVAIAVAVIGSLALPPWVLTADQALPVAVAFAAALCLLGLSLRRARRTWLDPAAPWMFLVVVLLLREQTGAHASQFAALVALPILWLAMTGTRRELWITAGLTGLLFLAPVLVIGAPRYPADDWRRALIWVMLAVVLAPALNRIVRERAAETERARTASAQMQGIARGARLTSIIATDLDGTIVLFSRGSEEMLGFSAAEVVGRRRLDELHDPEELATVAAELGIDATGFEVLREVGRRAQTSRLWTKLRRDGSRVDVRLAVTELTDGDGVVTGYLGVSVDATDGVAMIERLSQAEARWRSLLDHIPDLSVIVLDADGVIQTVAGVGIMRQGLAGHVGQPLGSVSRAENMAILTPLITAAADGREGVAEMPGTTNGAEHEVSLVPLPPENGEPRVLLVARNVATERARERELVRAREAAETLFEDAPHGVAVLREDGVVVQVNRTLAAMLDRPREGLRHTVLTACSPEDPAVLLGHLERAMEQRDELVEDLWTVRDGDGVERRVSLSSRTVRSTGLIDPVDETLVLVHLVDVSERIRYQERLAHLADHDVLTGLANRRVFDRALDSHQQRCRRYGATGALLLLDLDHFKDVNDTLGHGAGDQLIVSAAQLLTQHTRTGDLVARLGGDEFAVLLPETDAAGARTVAANLVARIREHTATLDGTCRRVTASIGAVMFAAVGDDGLDALALADLTMYDAKDAGRDRFALLEAGGSGSPRSGARLEWNRRIDAALENEDLVLHLQPILDLHTDRITSAEVLVRLSDVPGELALPADFLHVAERSGKVVDLDVWVLRHSIAMLADLRRATPDFRLEVNLSGASIGDPRIEAAIVASLAEHGVDPAALVLEVTETAAVADVTAAQAFAERMARLGCPFALDHFGAGFGSFYYLKHLIFDYVKIDGEFVAGCHRSTVDRTIVRSIVGIARGLDKLTVAEHVGDAEVLAVVRQEGVDRAQGSHIGRPVERAEFQERYLNLPAAV